MKKHKALEKAFRKANLIGYSVNIYEVIDSYKTFENATNQEREAIYNYISDRLGFSRHTQLTEEQYTLLVKNQFIVE
ncbi:hypothetical protein A616_17255 [Brevibacillus brevis X23]|nr:hypothetical protein A616_17255 [Brevibacillus brevis X23]